MFAELKVYAACFVTIIVADLIWLGFIMTRFYTEKMRPIGRITGDKFEPIWWAAAAVYVVLSVAIVQFALPKLSSDATVVATFATGALLGFLIYATYDFTNYSTLKDWTLSLALVDMLWGAVLGGLVTSVARYVRDL